MSSAINSAQFKIEKPAKPRPNPAWPRLIFSFLIPHDKYRIDSCIAGYNRARPHRPADSRIAGPVRIDCNEKKIERQKLPLAVGLLPVGLRSQEGL